MKKKILLALLAAVLAWETGLTIVNNNKPVASQKIKNENQNKPLFHICTDKNPAERKPAVYLYPKKPTKVNITLDKSIIITLDIPKYSPKGWNVLAYPDGRIKDLQPKFTDCKKLNSKEFGSEYAQKACKENNYPYVYWEGTQTVKPIPVKQEGWIVRRKELSSFLDDKLSYMKFNDSEKAEFMRYWVTKLSSNGHKKYFINFMQNEEVEQYYPMKVTPEPNHINRIYMIVKPIDKIDVITIPKPQKLKKICRRGFSLVDWGGMVLD